MACEKNFIQCLNELKKMLELTNEERENLKIISPQFAAFEKLNKAIEKSCLGKHLDDNEQNFILTNYPKMKISKIAFELNRSQSVVRNFLARKGKFTVQTKKETLSDSNKDYILANYEMCTVQEMAKKLGKEPYQVRNFLYLRGLRAKRKRYNF